MSYDNQPTLDCQDCGDVIRRLSPAEAQKMARDPHNCIVWYVACWASRERNGWIDR